MLSATASNCPFGPGGPAQDTITFSLAPAAVQTGLNTLATTDGLTDPTSTTVVSLGNANGVETYSVTLTSTGTVSRLTVDVAGKPVTAPTRSTTTFGALASAPAAEITAIATAKSLTAPTSDTVVNVTTTAAGVATYSVRLVGTATPVASTGDVQPDVMILGPGGAISVDSSGNPVGDQQLPFSVFSSTIQSALNAGAPTGATALAATSTQNVDVRTTDGITTYSTQFTVSGTDTTVTVNAAGKTVTPASKTTADFSAVPAAAQTELQALATAKGYTDAIAATQSVTVYTETGGATMLYAVTLSVSDSTTSSSTIARTHDETFVVDAAGNPTALPMDQGGPGAVGGAPGFGGGGPGTGGGSSGGGWGHGGGDGSHQGPPPDGSSSGGGGDNGGSGTVSSTQSSTADSVSAFSVGSAVAAVLGSDTPATPTLGASIGLFASALTNTTVLSDLVTLRSDAATLKSDVKGLSKADAKTLKTDETAIAMAIKAMSGTLSPGRKTLKSDAAKYAKTLAADQRAIRKAGSDATALATADAKLATDEATAYAALAADLDVLKTLIDANAGVTAAQSKLSTDLPAIATAQKAVVTAYGQFQTDVGTALTDAAS